MDGTKYKHFYGNQSEQFTFYKVPKQLFVDGEFHNVSAEAKLLYGILLDRMSLSSANGWFDEDGKVYIIFTIEEIKASLGCASKGAKTNLEKKSVANLLNDSKKLTNMEISETDIAGFEKYAKKYRVDYEIKMDDSVTPSKYLVFFKADDGKDMTKAFKAYLASVMQKEKKPSVLKQLSKFKEKVRAMPKKVRNKDKEHSL